MVCEPDQVNCPICHPRAYCITAFLYNNTYIRVNFKPIQVWPHTKRLKKSTFGISVPCLTFYRPRQGVKIHFKTLFCRDI